MPYSRRQMRMLMARAHGARLEIGGPSQAEAKKMLRHSTKKERSSAMRGRVKRSVLHGD